MVNFFSYSNVYFVPEVFLMLSLSFLLPLCVSFTNIYIGVGRNFSLQVRDIVILFFFLLGYLYFNASDIVHILLASQIVKDTLSVYFILLVFFGVISVCIFSKNYLVNNFVYEFEFFIIFIIIFLGSSTVIFSNDLFSIYLGIELQSLGLYILASYKQNSLYSTEAGVKYFVLGAFASSLLLVSFCLLYGATGLTNLLDISVFQVLLENIYLDFFLGISFFFMFIGLIFKIGGAPFHVWVPDVYEGVGTVVTAFFSLVPKVAIVSFIFKSFDVYSNGGSLDICLMFSVSGFLSIFVGTIGALSQITFKRLLSYSAISHSGFILFSFSALNLSSLHSVLLYLLIYIIVIINIFGILLQFVQNRKVSLVKLVSNLRYYYLENKYGCIMLVVSFFSIAGVPPLSGFFAKFFIFFSCISAGYIVLSFFLILLSVIGFIYYLRVIRSLMLFQNNNKRLLFNRNFKDVSAYIVCYSFYINVTFFVMGGPFVFYLYNICLYYFY